MDSESISKKDKAQKEKKTFEKSVPKLTVEVQTLKNALKLSAAEYDKLQSQLIEVEQRYNALAENSNDLIFEISKEGEFLYISPNFEKVLGYKPADLLNNSFHALLHPDEVKNILRTIKPAVTELNPQRILSRIKHKNGDWLWFESEGTGFVTKDDEVRFVVIARTIEQRKVLEDELMRMQKLDSLGILAGGIAHDFNNLLTAIMINISTACMDIPEEDEKLAILKEAKNACKQAKELTQQLLTFSKSGSPVTKTTSIIALIKKTVDFALRGSNVNCEYELPLDLKAVDVDEVQISQVINNIVLNAVQAMPEGGSITISAENFEVVQSSNLPLDAGAYVKMTFKDKGIGISKENMDKVFDPYFTTKFEGSGLGLSISYSIIKNHGGLLTLESSEGIGTFVTLYLPVSKADFVPSIGEDSSAKPQKGVGKILIMDDEEIIRISLGKMLERLGYEVVLTKNGYEAVANYSEHFDTNCKFDLVIVDLTVPGGFGGKKTIQKLREIDPNIKAVVASGYLNHPVLLNYKKFGFVAVLKKPFEIEEVSKKIIEIMQN